ncbi:MAG TPA: phosphodiesterase [Pseudomonadales bacterium]|nr:phosphodiesterase [Pseudomonadales bacterium]
MIRHVAMAAALLGSISFTHADVVTIPVSQQGDEARRTELPKRGTHKDTLLAKWGEPITSSGPVGTPPIYRMDYSDFFVVLEGNWVIRSVLKAPEPQQ